MSKVLFISEDYLKRNTTIDENVDVKLILPTLIDTQENDLIKAIGESLYNDLVNKINTSTTTAADDLLIERYIPPYLVAATLFNLITAMTFKFTNKSISLKSSENTQTLDAQRYQRLADKYAHRMFRYRKQLQMYICNHTADFQKFCKEECWEIMPDFKNIYTSLNL